MNECMNEWFYSYNDIHRYKHKLYRTGKKIKIQPNVQIQTSYSTYLDRKTSSGVLCINVSDHFPVLHIHDLRNKNSDCKKVYSNIEISVINKRH